MPGQPRLQIMDIAKKHTFRDPPSLTAELVVPHWARRRAEDSRVTNSPRPIKEVLRSIHGGQRDLEQTINPCLVPILPRKSCRVTQEHYSEDSQPSCCTGCSALVAQCQFRRAFLRS